MSLRTAWLYEILPFLKKVCVWGWGLLVVGVSHEKTCPAVHRALRPFSSILFLAGKSTLTSWWPLKIIKDLWSSKGFTDKRSYLSVASTLAGKNAGRPDKAPGKSQRIAFIPRPSMVYLAWHILDLGDVTLPFCVYIVQFEGIPHVNTWMPWWCVLPPGRPDSSSTNRFLSSLKRPRRQWEWTPLWSSPEKPNFQHIVLEQKVKGSEILHHESPAQILNHKLFSWCLLVVCRKQNENIHSSKKLR